VEGVGGFSGVVGCRFSELAEKHRMLFKKKTSRLKTKIRIREPIGSREKKQAKQIQGKETD
jgi:hypothetical protein